MNEINECYSIIVTNPELGSCAFDGILYHNYEEVKSYVNALNKGLEFGKYSILPIQIADTKVSNANKFVSEYVVKYLHELQSIAPDVFNEIFLECGAHDLDYFFKMVETDKETLIYVLNEFLAGGSKLWENKILAVQQQSDTDINEVVYVLDGITVMRTFQYGSEHYDNLRWAFVEEKEIITVIKKWDYV